MGRGVPEKEAEDRKESVSVLLKPTTHQKKSDGFVVLLLQVLNKPCCGYLDIPQILM